MTYFTGTTQWKISGDVGKARRELTGLALKWLHVAREAKHLGKFTWYDTGWRRYPQGNIRVVSTPSVETVYMDAVSGGEIAEKQGMACTLAFCAHDEQENKKVYVKASEKIEPQSVMPDDTRECMSYGGPAGTLYYFWGGDHCGDSDGSPGSRYKCHASGIIAGQPWTCGCSWD